MVRPYIRKTFNAATPVNSQNDGAYTVETNKRQLTKRRLLRKREHLNRDVSQGISWCVCNGENLCCVLEPGAKLNNDFHCEHVHRRGLLSVN